MKKFITVIIPLLISTLPLLFISCKEKLPNQKFVKFIAKLHKPTTATKVYLTGNNIKLGNWDPLYLPMTKENDSLWSVRLEFVKGEKLEYKVTCGSFWTQAVNNDEKYYDNFKLDVKSDTVVTVDVFGWLNKMSNGIPVLSSERFRPKRPNLELEDLWRYYPGDSLKWAEKKYEDRNWVLTDSYIQWSRSSEPEWNGIGWFRFHMYVDSSLWNKTLAIKIEELGASQIYYNGKLLYSFGNVEVNKYQPNAMTWWQEFKIDPQYEQVIVVRYANYDWKSLKELGYYPGFLISIKNLNSAFRTAVDLRENSERQMFFTLIPLILALVHLSLYGFLRIQRQNLYYAICMLGFAGLTYFNYTRNLVVDVDRIILLSKLGLISVSVIILFGTLTGYELNYYKMPRRIWLFAGMFFLISALIFIGYPFSSIMTFNYIFFGFLLIEIIYSFFKKKRKSHHGGWLLAIGSIILCVFILLQLLVDYSIITPTSLISQSYAYGMLSIAISMSIFLSYNFARVNKDLEVQLQNVKQLSDKTIEQERLALASELQRKTIELESERKSRELESARQLQLSLLPKELPQIDYLDIACRMNTATEVGGDYYDFFVSEKNKLTVVTGDATGHGLKAGNMVIAIKGILNILFEYEDLVEILNDANKSIKKMNLNMLTMCAALLRFYDNKIELSSAGMPPLLIYRNNSKSVEKLVLKAMPLGAFSNFPYKKLESSIEPGDIILMTSDGLPEMFNNKKETYGEERVIESLKEAAEKSAMEILDYLFAKSYDWSGNTPLADDVTIIVIKIK